MKIHSNLKTSNLTTSNPMPKIYLRISRYVGAFLRACGDGQSLAMDEPVRFSPYTRAHVVLLNGLRIVPEEQQHRAQCYSQSAWQNMLRGRLPQGGKPIIVRNPDDYLTYAEVCTLEHLPNTTKTEAYEYLCISVPREAYIGGRVERVGKSHTLDTSAAKQLVKLLRQDFVRAFLEFMRNNEIFALSEGIERTNVEILERFMMRYDMPVSHDQKERETLRRLVVRWRKEAEQLAQAPAIIGDPLITRIDEHERRGGRPKYDADD